MGWEYPTSYVGPVVICRVACVEKPVLEYECQKCGHYQHGTPKFCSACGTEIKPKARRTEKQIPFNITDFRNTVNEGGYRFGITSPQIAYRSNRPATFMIYELRKEVSELECDQYNEVYRSINIPDLYTALERLKNNTKLKEALDARGVDYTYTIAHYCFGE